MIQEALELHQKGQLEQAAEIYDRVLAENPHDADALHLLGLIRLKQGDLDQAESLIRNAIEIAPDADALQTSLGDLLLQRGDPERAMTFLEKASQTNPNNADALTGLGLCLLRTGGDRLKARDLFDRALLCREDHPLANVQRALLALDEGDALMAEELASAALRVQPEMALALMVMAEVFKHRKAFGVALGSAERAVAVDPGNFRARLLVAELMLLNNRAAQAEPILRELKTEQPHDPELLTAIGDLARQRGANADALNLYQAALQNSPNQAPIAQRIGETLGDLGRWAEAEQIWQQFVEQQPNQAGWRVRLAVAQKRQDKIETARANLPDEKQLDDTDRLEAYRLRAELDLLKGDFDTAEHWLNKASSISQNNVLINTMRAGLMLRADNPTDAEALSLKALTSSQSRSRIEQLTARRLLILALDQQEKFNQAARHLFKPGNDTPLPATELLKEQADRIAAFASNGHVQAEPTPTFLVGFGGSGLETLAKAISLAPGTRVLADRLGRNVRSDFISQHDHAMPADRSDPDSIALANRRYWKGARRLAGDSALLVDVIPAGKANPELLARHFPGARILFVRRSASDIVLQTALWGYSGDETSPQMLEYVEVLQDNHRLAAQHLPLEYTWLDFDQIALEPEKLAEWLAPLGIAFGASAESALRSGLVDEFGLPAYWPKDHASHYIEAMRSTEPLK